MMNSFKSIFRSNRIYEDSFWALSGNALGKGLGMLAGVIIARLLGADIFGEYGMVKSSLTYAAIFSTFGLGYTATRYIARAGNRGTYSKSVIRKSLLITLATSASIMAIILLLSFFDSKLSEVLRFTALIVVFNAMNTTQVGILAGLKDFKSIAVNNAVEGAVAFVAGCALTYFFGLDGSVFALFLSTGTQCVLNARAIRKNWMKMPEDSDTVVPTGELLSFSLPIALQEAVFAAASWLRLLVLMKLADSVQLGLYTASVQWYNLILFVPSVLRNVVLSHLSSTANDQHNETFNMMLKVNLIAAVIPAFVLAACSYPIEMVYGGSFSGFALVLTVCAFTAILGCIANIYTQEFISRGNNWLILGGYALRDGGTTLVLWILLLFGFQSAAVWAYVVSALLHCVYCLVLRYRYKKI